MLFLTIKMYFSTLLFILSISVAYSQDRKITSILNPDCNACTDFDTLLYIRADGAHDSIHQVWDFTRRTPTVIFLISSLNLTLNVTWNSETPKFTFSEEPKYSFAIAIDKIYEYNDTEDNGHFDDRYPQRPYPLNDLLWIRQDLVQSNNEVKLIMRAHHLNDYQKGTIEIKLDLLPYQDYAVDLPHLIHTSNSTLIDVNLVNLTCSEDYQASRFALHFLLVSTDRKNDTMNYTMRKSLDDEHTPGVFEIVEIVTPASRRRGVGGFLQFRPVAYTQPQRGVSVSTSAHVSHFNRTELRNDSTLKTFYRHFDRDNVLVQDMVVSFGDAADGYYKQQNYTSWSFTVGHGTPPKEGFSLFVIMIISIGLGIPVTLALSSVVYLVVRKYKHRNPPTRLLNDE
ncbi:glycosylated lysosomal membrane protein A-like [Galleria mellonella]|uniref:Glycosylated lysosomal membrane protein A-like n=1 Tax=Galleria mellonella TaxID=7137 RepID=A0A6J1W9V8_GALME|nr:glycosylated lysosomal membrane protein A-like [Galleria mellonella]